MKTFIFLGLALLAISCNKINKEEESKIGLYAKFIRPKANVVTIIPVNEFLFTEDDIISFNLTTREIIFTDVVSERLSSSYGCVGHSTPIHLFLNGKRLFKNPIYFACDISSIRINDLVLYYSIEDRSKYYLNDGYPSSYNGIPDEIRKVREKNAQMRKRGWNTFVDHLRKAGKIVN